MFTTPSTSPTRATRLATSSMPTLQHLIYHIYSIIHVDVANIKAFSPDIGDDVLCSHQKQLHKMAVGHVILYFIPAYNNK